MLDHVFSIETRQCRVRDNVENDHVNVFLQLTLEEIPVSADARIVDQEVDLQVLFLNLDKEFLSTVHLA